MGKWAKASGQSAVLLCLGSSDEQVQGTELFPHCSCPAKTP